MATRADFAKALCDALGAPRNKRNLWALVAWMQAEGGSARFNPLNTTKAMPGSTDYNSVGVKNYTSFAQGVEATAQTLLYGAERGLYGYRPIVRRLRHAVLASWTLKAVEASAWGTGGLALACLKTVKSDWTLYSQKEIAS